MEDKLTVCQFQRFRLYEEIAASACKCKIRISSCLQDE